MTEYCVRRKGDRHSSGVHTLEVETNLSTGEKDFKKTFGEVTSLEGDLLLVAASVLAADRASKRDDNENINRNVLLDIPVVNVSRLLPVVPLIESVLRLLSQDGWEIKLRHARGDVETSFDLPEGKGETLLFSGGLDSLAAAVEFGKRRTPLILVSHKTKNRATDTAQQELAALLQTNDFNVRHHQFFVSSKDGGPTSLRHDLENSQRTRSFVFLMLGALAARRSGHYKVLFLAENGQMAIHLPLSHGRIGAFSTHTAHPDVLAEMEALMTQVLAAPISISNPYVHRTKKEVVQEIVKRLPSAISLATSCWRNARMPKGVTHCGECIPCYVRRIAIERIGKDPTKYQRDPWRQPLAAMDEDDDGLRNLVDIVEFAKRFESSPDAELMSEFPELHSDNINAPEVIQMYRRSALEAKLVFGRYPQLRQLLQ
jgi:7-cyano-7-deazaguanine synthase in queuosine biosynthesis